MLSFGSVDFRSDNERTARYTRQTRNAVRKQNKMIKKQEQRALRHEVPPNVPMASQAPPVPAGMPAAQWNGTVWTAWNPQGQRWMIWDGQVWR